jgi:hypothetical protein
MRTGRRRAAKSCPVPKLRHRLLAWDFEQLIDRDWRRHTDVSVRAARRANAAASGDTDDGLSGAKPAPGPLA